MQGGCSADKQTRKRQRDPWHTPENILWEAPECVSAGADYVEAMILEVELLGAEKLLFFLLYGKKYVAKILAEYDARAGEVRRLYFDVTAIHLFDCDSEMRI